MPWRHSDTDPHSLVAWISDHLIGLRSDITEMRSGMISRFDAGEDRMQRMEEAIAENSRHVQSLRAHPVRQLLAFLHEVASPREWVIAAVLTVLWLSGVLTAAEIKAFLAGGAK